jgi:spermidine synthase
VRARIGSFAIALSFFASGATALGYEVLWERSLRLSFGISTYSVAIVAGAFMAGMSFGYARGRAAWLREFHPLRVYAVAEAAVALYALAFPWLHAVVDTVYVKTGGSLAVRTVLAVALLVVPTTFMGVTLPVVSRWLAERMSVGRAAATLLAANTLGGVAGTLGTGWYLIRVYGAAESAEMVMLLNLGIVLAVMALSLAFPEAHRRPGAEEGAAAPTPQTARRPASSGTLDRLTPAAFFAGFQTMALQVVWNRTLVCVVENNTTSFSLILASVLLGSALGALLYVPASRWLRGRKRSLHAFFVAEALLALLVLTSLPLLDRLYAVGNVVSTWHPVRGILDLCLDRWLVSMLPVLPASAAGAFLLPVLTEARARGTERVGEGGADDAAESVGGVFSADALGSLAGSLAAAFAMIPLFGLGGSLIAVAVVAVATGLLGWSALPAAERRAAVALPLAAATLAPAIFVGPLTLTRWYDGHRGVAGKLLFYDETVSGTISVFEVDERKELLINCIEEVPNHRDAMLFFKILGHTPLLLQPKPEKVLVNALGGGITLGAILTHPVSVEAVELVPQVRRAMQFFGEENNNAANRSDWRLIGDDGRNYLRLVRETYDVIAADATHPAAGESWPLYTREYYEIVRAHLAASGVFAQWLPLHNMIPADFLGVMKTFRSVFPETLVLFANRYCVLVGATSPLALDASVLTQRITADRKVADDLKPYGIENGEDLLKYLVLDGPGVDRVAAGANVLTDDRASVEFAELRRLGVEDTFPLDLEKLVGGLDGHALARRTGLATSVFDARKDLLEAQLVRRKATLESTFEALVKLEGAKQMAPRDQDVAVALETLQLDLLETVSRDYRTILQRSDLDRVVEALYYAQQLHPDDPFLNQVLGAAFLRLRRFADAVPYLERAAAAKPDDPNFQSNLIVAYEQSGRYAEALDALSRLEALGTDIPGLDEVRRRLENERAEKGKRS